MCVTDIQNLNLNLSMANLDKKILFGKITHLKEPTIRKNPIRGLYGNPKFHIPFWSLIYVALKFTSSIYSNRILISITSKLWTRMECAILFSQNAPYQHLHNFWVLNDE